MNAFVLGYIECALWAETVCDGDEYGDRSFEDLNFEIDDLAPEALQEMKDACEE